MNEISSEDWYLLKIVAILCLISIGISGLFYLCGLDERFYISPIFLAVILLWASAEAIGKRDMQMYNN